MCDITRRGEKISSENLNREMQLSDKFSRVIASIALAEKYVADPSSMPMHVSTDINKAYQATVDVDHMECSDICNLACDFVNHKVGNAGFGDLDEYEDELSLDARCYKANFQSVYIL